jgi:DNA-binding response OmpR family regulator
MKILVVEDELALAEALTEILRRSQYSVDAVYNGEDGLEYGCTGLYDCIVLDIMLPIMDGLQVLRQLRKNKISTPVMLLTAKSEVEDKICGLDCGADDYLTKPFSTGELLARIRALTRRTGEVNLDTFDYQGLSLNKHTYMLSYSNQSVKLSLKEYQIMEMLLKNPNQIITKERFIEKIWGFESDVEYNNLEVYISFLRKKLHSIQSKANIHTTRGVGYYLEAQA